MEVKTLRNTSAIDASKLVSGILNIVESVFVPEMRKVYMDRSFFLEQLMNQENINICCFNKDGELTGYLLAIPHNNKLEELSAYDPCFEYNPENDTYYIEIIMSHSSRNHETKRSFILMIDEFIREAYERGKHYATMHALQNEGLSHVIMKLYPVKILRTQTFPELYGSDEIYDFLTADIHECYQWIKEKRR